MLKITRHYGNTFEHNNASCTFYKNFMFAKREKHNNVKKFYDALGVAEDCEDETLRLAFVYQVKRFHPDSGTSEANATKFSEIETAYRQIRKIRMRDKENTSSLPEVEDFDIKHTAPQHRHYLVYNVGIGTPSKRQKMYIADKAQKAIENVMEHRLKKLQAEEHKSLVGMDKQRAKDIKTRFGMDRLVEDLIQEAMNKGEFKDLRGMGKPLKDNTNTRNPYVDFVTYKLNEILIENGFTPEWIQLSKEIREEKERLQRDLAAARNKIGPLPLTVSEQQTWQNIVDTFISTAKQINSKIDKYNLLVPILQKQMLQIKLKDFANEALSLPPKETTKKQKTENEEMEFSVTGEDTVLGAIMSIFSKKI